jgi:hypothetical protein
MSLRKLKLAAGAGEPDDVLALRIDVVACAEIWADQLRSPHKDDFEWAEKLDEMEEKLYRATCRYQAAVARRRRA